MWIFSVNFCSNVTKIFLVNILVIWDGRCDFFGSLSVSGQKKSGVKKKSSENSPFFVFFLKNDQILTNTKTFKIRFFFFTETHKQVHNILLNTFQIVLGWNKHIRILFWYFYSTCGKKNYFLRKIEIFFSRDLLFFLKKIIFLFFCFFGKICHFMKKKKHFDPFFLVDFFLF